MGGGMLKKDGRPTATFADVWLSHPEKNWNKHWLKKVSEKVNWNKFGYRLEKLYSEDNGRPAWQRQFYLAKCPICLF